MGRRRDSTSTINTALGWLQKQPKKVHAAVAAMSALAVVGLIVALHMILHSDYFFVISEVMYAIGLLVLVYKLATHKNCSGLSLKTQEITAIFLAARMALLGIGSDREVDLHLVVDSVSLISTAWIIYMMRFKLQSTYAKQLDNIPIYYLVVPCFVLALLVNPFSWVSWFFSSLRSLLWAFSTYLESVSVLPQLRLIQNAKMVEPFTALYVFALGVARFFGFAHWALLVYRTSKKSILLMAGQGYLWFPMALLAELVQTFILADYCYYYIKSVLRGQQMLLPLPV